jgi:hypothetical protein
MRRRRALLAALVLLSVTAAEGGVRGAEPPERPEQAPEVGRLVGYLALGGLYSHAFSPEADGIGLEATYNLHVDHGSGLPSLSTPGFGFLGQVQAVDSHVRTALGAQGNYGPLGVELAWAFQGGENGTVGTHGIQIAPFVSFVLLSVALRVVPQLTPGTAAAPAYPTEVGIALTFKIPLWAMPSGNPDRPVTFVPAHLFDVN